MPVETGHLTEFHLEDGAATPVMTKLSEILEVPLPSGAADLIETSHMETTGFKSYMNSPLKEGEEADLVMNYIPNSATDVLLREAKIAGTARGYRIVLQNAAATWEITGSLIVRDYVRSNPMADRRTATARVKWVDDETEAVGV